MRSEVQVFPDPPLYRGYSSAGRAPALQAGGQEFDPPYLHQDEKITKICYFLGEGLRNLRERRKREQLKRAKDDKLKPLGDLFTIWDSYRTL